MVKGMFWGLCAVFVAAILFTITKIGWMLTKAPRGPDWSIGIDYVSFARTYLFSAKALAIAVLVFVLTFLIVTRATRKVIQ